MFEGLFSRWSLVLIKSQKLSDEIFGLGRDVSPDWISEGKFTRLDLFHDLLITGSIEWRDTRKSNKGNNTTRPNITFRSIVLGKNFWSDVVRST